MRAAAHEPLARLTRTSPFCSHRTERASLILIAFHNSFHNSFHNCPPPFPNGDPFLSFVASCLLLYDIDFIHNSLPPILGPGPRWVSVSLCIKSQSSSYLSHGGWARTTNCLGVCSCESVSHSLWLSLFSSTDFSQSITPQPTRTAIGCALI